jgi:predicted ATPase
VLLDEAAHEGTPRLIAEGTPAPPVGAWGEVPSTAVPPQTLLDKGLADAKEGSDGALRTESLIPGTENLLSKVKRVSFHTLEHNALPPYKQSITAIGAGMAVSHWLVLLAEAYGHAGQAEEGLRLLAEAVGHVNSTGERKYAAEVYWLKGKLLWQQTLPDAVQAETCLHQALDIARHQQTKSWELRAATSLARLWQQQGKRAEARELLAPIYGWFTEGFDTADLQEAKAWLEALAS